jgi:hypothetical protein
VGKINWLRILHWFIIINFAVGILYGAYLSMFVFGGGGLPLFRRASTESLEIILKRRLYSLETWVAISGLATYLAITEVLPRRIGGWRESSGSHGEGAG